MSNDSRVKIDTRVLNPEAVQPAAGKVQHYSLPQPMGGSHTKLAGLAQALSTMNPALQSYGSGFIANQKKEGIEKAHKIHAEENLTWAELTKQFPEYLTYDPYFQEEYQELDGRLGADQFNALIVAERESGRLHGSLDQGAYDAVVAELKEKFLSDLGDQTSESYMKGFAPRVEAHISNNRLAQISAVAKNVREDYIYKKEVELGNFLNDIHRNEYDISDIKDGLDLHIKRMYVVGKIPYSEINDTIVKAVAAKITETGDTTLGQVLDLVKTGTGTLGSIPKHAALIDRVTKQVASDEFQHLREQEWLKEVEDKKTSEALETEAVELLLSNPTGDHSAFLKRVNKEAGGGLAYKIKNWFDSQKSGLKFDTTENDNKLLHSVLTGEITDKSIVLDLYGNGQISKVTAFDAIEMLDNKDGVPDYTKLTAYREGIKNLALMLEFDETKEYVFDSPAAQRWKKGKEAFLNNFMKYVQDWRNNPDNKGKVQPSFEESMEFAQKQVDRLSKLLMPQDTLEGKIPLATSAMMNRTDYFVDNNGNAMSLPTWNFWIEEYKKDCESWNGDALDPNNPLFRFGNPIGQVLWSLKDVLDVNMWPTFIAIQGDFIRNANGQTTEKQ